MKIPYKKARSIYFDGFASDPAGGGDALGPYGDLGIGNYDSYGGGGHGDVGGGHH